MTAYIFARDSEILQGLVKRSSSLNTEAKRPILLFVVGAIVLGIVVLYNLGVMSYIERSRELATLKVLGFRDKNIGKLLTSQNIWLTVVGVIIGLPSAIGVLHVLLITLADEYELKLCLGILTYAVSLLVTFGVSLAASLMVARKNKKSIWSKT